MIKGVHTMFDSSKAEELRAFLRDKLGFPATDVGDGWLIFQLPEADMGCHPTEPGEEPSSGTHNISFYCDDFDVRVELQQRPQSFTNHLMVLSKKNGDAFHGHGRVAPVHLRSLLSADEGSFSRMAGLFPAG